ncbi:DYW domain [Dillenia turbinata]|uniref:DYW domain n=1 Tax=Dillenia turbinata TaxID=194707 RepID=A0AAN8VCD1_9MAGN
MAFALPIVAAKTSTAGTTIPQFLENPKTLILHHCKTTRDLNQIHAHVIKTRLHLNPIIVESLLESAAILLKSTDYAVSIFDQIDEPNSAAYNVIIRGFILKHSSHEAIRLFKKMEECSVEPDNFTFPCILKACSRLQAVKEGEQIHAQIVKLGFPSNGFVVNSLIHMYASFGKIEVARRVFDGMSDKGIVSWNSLFSGYTKSGHWEEIVNLFREMVRLGVNFDEATLLGVLMACGRLADIGLGKSEDALRLRSQMKEKGIKKSPGCTLIELDGEIHEILAEENKHPYAQEIYNATESMMKRINLAGYVPNTAEARLEAEDDDRGASVSHHSEKLAIALGIIRTSPGTTIRISKNLRVCIDCHNATKFISKVFHREIVVRDRNRFHHFKDGICSCKDYW